jgi:hypothetical protein
MRPYLRKPFTIIGPVEWLKVKALSSSSSTEKKIHILTGIDISSFYGYCSDIPLLFAHRMM